MGVTAALASKSAVDVPRVCVVGPVPPPSGGMANQCEQLVRLMGLSGVPIQLVRNNAPYRPAWVGGIPMLRAMARLLPYLRQLWLAAGRSQVLHVLANSGWAWHLLALPALVVARMRGCAVIVNYRGGNADTFFTTAPRHVLSALCRAELRVTPSQYLVRVFARHGLPAEVIPNIIDLTRFSPAPRRDFGDAPHLIVTRNLEAIYDLPTALRAFAAVRCQFPGSRLTVAGSGPEREALVRLTRELGLDDAVNFSGRIDNERIPALYAAADCMLNPSTVDNMPISILEAFASGVPVVSTNAGGIPDMLTDGIDGLLVPIGNPDALAAATLRVLQDPALARHMRESGLTRARQFAWPCVRDQWLDAYRRAAALRCRS